MNFRRLILGLVFLGLTAPLFARDKTDVLIMKNGDRMTCEVKGLDAGVLYVSFDYIDGTASVDWSKVARLESTQLFVVKTQDGSAYTGSLKTAENPGGLPVQIRILEASEKEDTLKRSQIVQMVATSDRFWQRFNGEVSFGTIYSKGNESTQYSLGSEVTYVRERWSAGANYESSLSSSTGASASTRNSVNFIGLHLLPPKNWFYAGIGGLLESSEQGINLQGTLGAGIGRYLINTNRASIAVVGGAAWQSTNYQPSTVPIGQQNLATALFYADAKVFRFSKTNLDATAVVLPALSEPGRIRVNANVAYYIKIISDLKWNISFYGNWDNQPPTGLSGSDYGTSSGLSWTFGLK
jgi:putative salt-induced outer membrane protein YdiY